MPSMMPKTVNERMKMNGGYVAGPDHKRSSATIMQAMEQSDAVSPEQSGPPNLRDAAQTMDSCAMCASYAGQRCTKHDADVMPSEICDDFTAPGMNEPEEAPMESPEPEEDEEE